MLTLQKLIQKVTETERQEKMILCRLKTIGIVDVEKLRWTTLEDLKESMAFGPLYLKKMNQALILLRGD